MKNSILLGVGLVACVALPIGIRFTKEGGSDFFYRVVDSEKGTTKIIYVDGGGDIHNFNTTTAGDYQCHQLETLCNEWTAAHPGYKAVVNKYSNNGSRDTLITQLSSGTAPHIIYQNGSVVNSDLNFDYYVHLTDYLNQENPYFLDNNGVARKWKEVYNENELASTQASNGEYYYVNLEKQPVCLIYNKDILSAAGVTNPENISTYEQLMSAFDQIKAYRNNGHSNIDVYNTQYQWYSIAMESSLYSNLIDIGDVIGTPNHKVSTEELCRLYYKDLYKFDGRFTEYISLIKRINSYKSPSDDPNTSWFAGTLAFMEGTGLQLSQISKKSTVNWGIIPYPAITKDTYQDAGKPVVRGVAGLATSYWVTKRAANDGTEKACVDLLMYLTAPAQNNRLINELGVGIPLNPTDKSQLPSYLQPIVASYEADLEEYAKGNMVGFDAFNSWGVMSTLYNNQFIIATKNMGNIQGDGVSVNDTVNILKNSFASEYETMVKVNRYDPTKW